MRREQGQSFLFSPSCFATCERVQALWGAKDGVVPQGLAERNDVLD